MQDVAAIDYKALYQQSESLNQSLQLQVLELTQQLAQLKKMFFASKHERFIASEQNTSQLSLDIQAEAIASCSVVDAKRVSYTKTNVTVEQKPLTHPETAGIEIHRDARKQFEDLRAHIVHDLHLSSVSLVR